MLMRMITLPPRSTSSTQTPRWELAFSQFLITKYKNYVYTNSTERVSNISYLAFIPRIFSIKHMEVTYSSVTYKCIRLLFRMPTSPTAPTDGQTSSSRFFWTRSPGQLLASADTRRQLIHRRILQRIQCIQRIGLQCRIQFKTLRRRKSDLRGVNTIKCECVNKMRTIRARRMFIS